MQNNSNSKSVSTGDRINDFVQRNRAAIFIIMGVIIFMFVGLVTYLSLSDYLQKKAIAEVEELNRRFTDLHLDHDHNEEDAHEFADAGSAEVQALLEELEAFAKRNQGFAGAKAWSLVGHIYTRREDWPQAEDAWLNAAKKGNRTYLSPISFFNAAAAAEEQGRLEQAVEYYGKSVSHPFAFAAAPRAQFAVGRLNETLENFPAAIEAYRAVMIKWPNIDVWVNLAQSRIAVLEAGQSRAADDTEAR